MLNNRDVVPPIAMEQIRNHLNGLAKPPGSLGRLEELAVDLCRIQRTTSPVTRPRRCVIFAADHGVVRQGVSLWPSSVSQIVVQTMLNGGAASSVLARQFDVDYHVVDVGLLNPPRTATGHQQATFHSQRIRAGTADLSREPAMTVDEASAAWSAGAEMARAAIRDGMRLLVPGEMGIGNTTSAAAIGMLLAEVPLELAVGPGAGATPESLDKKRSAVMRGVSRSRQMFATDPNAAIAGVSGLEILAMAGCMETAVAAGLVCVLDGFIATAAALIAEFRTPGTRFGLIAAHRSAEPGHTMMLQRLELRPYLDWGCRLGEATGGLLLVPMLDAAAAVCVEMATLESVLSTN